MADHKNQHYVPRCALKPFTLNAEGNAINLYNLNRRQFIQNAPVKGQCSRNFFYGKDDLGPEKALSELEGQYARIVEVIKHRRQVTLPDVEWLRLFAIIQTRRTAQAVFQLSQFTSQMMDAAFKNDLDQRPDELEHEDLVRMSMMTGFELANRVDDLKFIVLNNRTDVEFVTSDHPSVISNRFSFERLNRRDFGIASSGSFLALPLTPRYLALFFDIGVYTISIPRGSPFVDVKIAADIRALNELQQLNAQQNIYFCSWADRGNFAYQNAQLDNQRGLKPKIQTLVRDHSLAGQVFRSGTADEEASSSQRVIGSSTQHPRPSHWPSFLKIRPKPATFFNGSAAGHVRKEEWLRG